MPAPTALTLLWGSQDRPRRGPKPSLTLEGIVDEAIALADAEGLANLSMARLAERLGCAKMALYRYVPGKGELTALMFDAALGAPPERTAAHGDSSEYWRDYLRLWTETFFERACAHSWALELIHGVRPIGPNEMSWLESALAELADTGLNASERLDAIVLLLGHGRSLVQTMAGSDADAEGRLATEIAGVLKTHSERYPSVAAAYAEQAAAADPGRNNALDFGIDRILDGLASLMATRRT
ncbi:TetR/AcrR family transcriptional regulator [Nocardia jejuensis]|uniref:TetR/AcrR family transcriptional regulator n=1 Tax=Nocardia jejuensis TaxID=328049 RepID=UPI00082A52A3|nr:TetR/AcrR family transcriptional regulator [Nocardia jejuensis]